MSAHKCTNEYLFHSINIYLFPISTYILNADILNATKSADSAFSLNKSAEKATTKVRKSIKSLTNASSESKMSKDLKPRTC